MLLRKRFGVLSGLLQTGRDLNDQEKQDRNKFLAHVLLVTPVSKTGKVLGSPTLVFLQLGFYP